MNNQNELGNSQTYVVDYETRCVRFNMMHDGKAVYPQDYSGMGFTRIKRTL